MLRMNWSIPTAAMGALRAGKRRARRARDAPHGCVLPTGAKGTENAVVRERASDLLMVATVELALDGARARGAFEAPVRRRHAGPAHVVVGRFTATRLCTLLNSTSTIGFEKSSIVISASPCTGVPPAIASIPTITPLHVAPPVAVGFEPAAVPTE